MSPNLSQDMRKAFITGVTGQDGSYLARLLLEKGNEAHDQLGWTPKVSVEQLAEMMARSDDDALT
ncbi:MAG: hypothetical protein CMF72_00815 [Mameliella sp.]|nr:hypothetical protein [Mameliella sp.]